MNKVPTFHLIYELLADGIGDLYPDLEPFNLDEICTELRKRSGKTLGQDVNVWVDWFLSEDCDAPNSEKKSIKLCKRIYDLEQQSLRQINDRC